uniref:Domain X domain-containing protein n=1 Tax=Caulerpa okamurae TaxID=118247 RepID=A0A3S5FWR2_9CHLO|nr:hypothetical protein [Caulerpa okamurae]
MVQRTKSPTIIPNTKLTKIRYCRYADDWIFFIDGPRVLPIFIKNKIQSWLNTYLNLLLSSEKTLITNLHKTFAHFLGFGIKVQKEPKRIIKRKTRNLTVLTRTGVGNAIFTIDIPRLESRLRIKRFIHPSKNKPHHKPEWTIFEDYRIIILYRQVLIGIFNYYKDSVNIFNELYFIFYIIKNSCAATLASKYKLPSRKKVYKKYGPNLSCKIPNSKNTIQIPTYKDLINREINKSYKPHVKDPLEITTNWRTRLKLTSYCCICSSTENIASY